MSCVMCHVSCVMCHVSHVTCPCHMSHFFSSSFFSDKVVKLIGGGSVINGAYPVYSFFFFINVGIFFKTPRIDQKPLALGIIKRKENYEAVL